MDQRKPDLIREPMRSSKAMAGSAGQIGTTALICGELAYGTPKPFDERLRK
jgi:hypothetical protein